MNIETMRDAADELALYFKGSKEEADQAFEILRAAGRKERLERNKKAQERRGQHRAFIRKRTQELNQG